MLRAICFCQKDCLESSLTKLDYISAGKEEASDGDWNRHPLDVSNLVEFVDGQEGWPPRLTSQVLSLQSTGRSHRRRRHESGARSVHQREGRAGTF